jgi:alpha-L-fucosidase
MEMNDRWSWSRRSFLAQSTLLAAASVLKTPLLVSQEGAPTGAPDAYAKPKPPIEGPFQPTWESIRDHYQAPSWFNAAKFGIFIHWGLYSIPAHINEWYIRHMYTTDVHWHTEHYGPPDKFGYKDFIPLFKAENYHPDQWAELFKQAGAKYVVPVAEHHDGFAMWNSDITPWCAGKMGPKRDLTGELATEVKRAGMIFGLSSHRMEHHTFAYLAPGVPNDEFDPRYAGFYGPPIPGNMNDGNASQAFQEDWLARVQELIDKYEPQLVYFDNGVNPRAYDPVKLRAAAYYFNRALQWNKEVTFATKDVAYLAGSIQDFEKQLRAPRWIYPYPWQSDDAIGSTWGYTTGMHYRPADDVVREIVELASMGGNLMLNVSPMGDGSIPDAQQKILQSVGEWLRINGEGIYDSRPWKRYGEGPDVPAECPPDWKGGSTANQENAIKRDSRIPITEADFRYTTVKDLLYAFGLKYPAGEATLRSLNSNAAKVERVTLLGTEMKPVRFRQTNDALFVSLPPGTSDPMPYALRIEGTRAIA